MVENSWKWNSEKVQELVELRNSDGYKTSFDLNKHNGIVVNKLWGDLVSECGFTLNPKKVAQKYSDLLCTYRREYIECMKTGGSPSTWKYWKLFSDNVNNGIEINPPVKIVVGGKNAKIEKVQGDNELLELKQRKGNGIQDIRRNAYSTIIDFFKSNDSMNQSRENENTKEIKKLNKKMKKMYDKLDLIIGKLTKNE